VPNLYQPPPILGAKGGEGEFNYFGGFVRQGRSGGDIGLSQLRACLPGMFRYSADQDAPAHYDCHAGRNPRFRSSCVATDRDYAVLPEVTP
jgi:hypothetical protein